MSSEKSDGKYTVTDEGKLEENPEYDEPEYEEEITFDE